MGGWIALAVVVFLFVFVIGLYNGLIQRRNRIKNAFAQIDVQLTRRYDLIPNLVETVKGYIKHERETLEAVIQARNTAVAGLKAASANPADAKALQQLAGAEGALSGALGRMFALAEAYPDLKANQNMMQLSEELTSTENRVAFARQAYNDAVLDYNNARETFPGSVVASAFAFTPATTLEIEDIATKRAAPKVSF
jgi:LemA protein